MIYFFSRRSKKWKRYHLSRKRLFVKRNRRKFEINHRCKISQKFKNLLLFCKVKKTKLCRAKQMEIWEHPYIDTFKPFLNGTFSRHKFSLTLANLTPTLEKFLSKRPWPLTCMSTVSSQTSLTRNKGVCLWNAFCFLHGSKRQNLQLSDFVVLLNIWISRAQIKFVPFRQILASWRLYYQNWPFKQWAQNIYLGNRRSESKIDKNFVLVYLWYIILVYDVRFVLWGFVSKKNMIFFFFFFQNSHKE